MPKSIYYKGGPGAVLTEVMLPEAIRLLDDLVSPAASFWVAEAGRWSDGFRPSRVVSLAIDTEIERVRGDNRV